MLLEEGVCYDQCILLAKLYSPLPCFIPYSKAKFACYSRCFFSFFFIFKFYFIFKHHNIVLVLPNIKMAGQEATVRTGHETTDCFQIGKGVCQGCILSPCLFNLYAEYIMRNTGLDEAQAGIKISRKNINNLR